MLFEIWKGKERMMYTDNENSIPDTKTIKLMMSIGYKATLNGKPYKLPSKKVK